MMEWKEILKITGGRSSGYNGGQVEQIATDSRSLPAVSNVLFVAIRGTNHNGNDYVPEVFEKGIRLFLTDQLPDISVYPGASFCLVKNAIEALQKIAGEKRRRFRGNVIAVAGSNGKTIVKEWLYQLLQASENVVRSPRSYNSQLGVPLSLWQLDDRYGIAIIEAGISMPGEMHKLADIINPDIGILTNIGPAHRENFKSDSEKISEKLTLFKGCEKVIYRSDQVVDGREISDFIIKEKLNGISWSLGKDADYTYKLMPKTGDEQKMNIICENNAALFSLPFSDDASVENLLHVITILLESGIVPGEINSRLKNLEPVEMRLETLKGLYNSTLINDVYNSDLAGLGVALDVLLQQKKHRQKIVILSDVYQSGMEHRRLYGSVGELLRFKGINSVICIGKDSAACSECFPEGTRFFMDTKTFIDEFDPRAIEGAAVLIKGARKFRFEDITRLLQFQIHNTVLEIRVNDLVHNLNYYRSIIDQGTKIMIMVKALSYGAGATEIAEFLQHEQIDYLAVAYPDEGIRLRQSGVSLPIIVMNAGLSDYRQMIASRLEPVIYSREGLLRVISDCRYMGQSDHPLHIKLDTGMHRLGFEPADIPWLASHLSESNVNVKSLFSHLAGSEDPALDAFTEAQVGGFLEMAARVTRETGQAPLLHILNSAGIERFPQYQLNMVRIGIGLYGIGKAEALRAVSSFRTVISQIRTVKSGDTVGYGRAGKVSRDSIIATIPVGYADGIDRRLGNGTYSFFVKGKYAPTIGNVCMDMTMIDVTGIDAGPGDSVELFGNNCPVEQMAASLETIVYEVITSIPERVKRVYIRE